MNITQGRKKRRLAIILVAGSLAFTGCASVPNSHVTPTLSDEAYLRLSPEAQQEYLRGISTEATALEAKKDAEFRAGRPVSFGDGTTGYTFHWMKRMGQVMIYPANSTGGLGQHSQAIMSIAVDNQARPIINPQTGLPTVQVFSASHQEGFGRFMIRMASGIFGSALNGALGSHFIAEAKKNDGGGGAIAISNSGSSAFQTLGSAVEVNTRSGAPCSLCGGAPQQ